MSTGQETVGKPPRPEGQGNAPHASLTPRILLNPAAGHTRFNPSQSSTYSTNGQTFSLQYGSGSLTGFFGYDTLTVSDAAGLLHPTPGREDGGWGCELGSNLTGLRV